MTRNAIILIFVFALTGVLFYAWKQDQLARFHAEEQRVEEQRKLLGVSAPVKGLVVFAARDIPKGGMIGADSLELFTTHIACGDGSVTSTSAVVGRKARSQILKGNKVSLYNLDPFPLECADPVIYASKEILKGKIICAEDVTDWAMEKSMSTPDLLSKSSLAIGKKATRYLCRGQVMVKSDVEP